MYNYEKDSYFLKSYVYAREETKRQSILEEAAKQNKEMPAEWSKWRCAILVETERSFFDTVRDTLPDEIRRGTRREFSYYNLNSWQSLLLFRDARCDYRLVAKQLYVFLKRRYTDTLHLSVSRKFEGYEQLPDILWQLERQIEEKYYHPDLHVFCSEEDEYSAVNAEAMDSRLLEKISEDVSRKDLEGLRRHFGYLVDKYQRSDQHSAMYMKFVFSSVIQELFWEREFARSQQLKNEIDRLYSSNSPAAILRVAQENIQKYCDFISGNMEELVNKINKSKEYIRQHSEERLDIPLFAQMTGVAPGYFSYVFQRETGMSIQRFIRISRMQHAKELLERDDMTVEQVCDSCGFTNVPYFGRSYFEFYGEWPRGIEIRD